MGEVMINRKWKFMPGKCFRTEPAPGGGAAGAAAAPAGLQPEPIVQDPDTITINEADFPDLSVADAAEAGQGQGEGESEAAGAAATEPRFVTVMGQKVQLDENGNIPQEALDNVIKGKYVPEATFQRELQRARGSAQEGAGRDGGETTQPAKKAPEPFKRAENNIDPTEDLPGYLRFENEQNRLERDHDRKIYDDRISDLNDAIAEERYNNSTIQVRSQFNEEFERAAVEASVIAGDSEPAKNLRAQLHRMVSQDKRHQYNPHTDAHGRPIKGLDSLTTKELVQEYWSAIKSYIDYREQSAQKKATKLSGEVATASPHKGGAVSMASKPAQPRNDTGRFVPSPLKQGEKAGDGIVRDAIRIAAQRK